MVIGVKVRGTLNGFIDHGEGAIKIADGSLSPERRGDGIKCPSRGHSLGKKKRDVAFFETQALWYRQKHHASCSSKKRGTREPTWPVFAVK